MNEQYRSIFEASYDGFIVHEGGVIIEVNPQFAAMVGYEPSELVGMSFMELVADESKAIVIERMATRPGTPYEIVGIAKDGSHQDVEVVGKDHVHEGRTVRVVTVRDIAERKRLEEELRKAREELEERVEQRMENESGNPYKLTFRELTVLSHLTDGITDKEIAVRLGISTLTVRKHVAHVRQKMKAASRTEASSRALREGLVN